MNVVMVNEEENIKVTIDSSTEFCSCITKQVFYFLGVRDPVKIEPASGPKNTPDDLKKTLDESSRDTKIDGTRWAEVEDQILTDAHEKYSILKISVMNLLPGRTFQAIQNRVTRLGLKKYKRGGQKKSYLLKWIEEKNLTGKEEGFTIDDFYKDYPKFKEPKNQGNLQKLISKLLDTQKLTQMGNDKFRVNKLPE